MLHSPADVRIHLFTDDPELRRLRDLPHVELHTEPSRAASVVAGILVASDGPTAVVVLDDAHQWRRTPRMKELLVRAARPDTAAAGLTEAAIASEPGTIVAICIAPGPEALPVECTAVAVVAAGQVRVRAGTNRVTAEAVGVARAHLEHLVGALTPLIDPDRPGVGLPADVSLTELLGETSIGRAASGRWSAPSMVVRVGTGSAGPVEVDLERDGPHLLIAGTTGSGKSELLQTLVAGLACAAPPDRTAFLLIDYKGGAAFGRLADLPHTTGVVTDLDQQQAARALRSLRAEVRRRERVLAAAGVADLSALREQVDRHCPPSLVVVVDEFATLGAERPEFLVGLLDVAQRGRSLGLHLVLATQRPSGVLSPAMKANIGLRICLRVTDDADSVDVIDSPAAARLPLGLPGRAYLRQEKGSVSLLQVARTCGVRRDQVRVRLRDHEDLRPADQPGPTDLDEIVEAVTQLSEGRRRPDVPWRPPLPADYRSTDPEVIALRDEPEEQRQTPVPVPSGSSLILGRPGSGRSSALRRLAWCAASGGAELLIVDPSGGLRELAGWPGTRTYLDGQDPVLVQRLVDRLRDLLRVGAGETILLVIDGWEAMAGALDGLDYGASVAVLTDLAGRGPAAGIRVAASGEPRMQHHRTAGSFTTVIRLGVDERNDPRSGPPGRGRLEQTEVQIARCPPATTAPPDAAGREAPVVRALPEVVTATDLPSANRDAVPLGLGDDDGSVQTLDLTGPGGGLLVTGPRRSGVSTALHALALGAAASGIRVVRAAARPATTLPGVLDVDLRSGVEPLRRLLVDHEGPILVLADGLEGAVWSDDALALLERFVTVCGPAQYLAVGARLDRALRSHRGLIAEVAAFRSGVLLQPDSADGSLFDVTVPRRRGRPPPGRGFLIRQGRAVPLQVARIPG